MILEELQRRNLSGLTGLTGLTAECRLRAVDEFAVFFKRPPGQLGLEQTRAVTGPSVYRQKPGRQHSRTFSSRTISRPCRGTLAISFRLAVPAQACFSCRSTCPLVRLLKELVLIWEASDAEEWEKPDPKNFPAMTVHLELARIQEKAQVSRKSISVWTGMRVPVKQGMPFQAVARRHALQPEPGGTCKGSSSHADRTA